MEYKVESSLEDFEAWSGGKDTLEVLINKGDCYAVEALIESFFYDGELPTDTYINDFLWFERDFIAEHLGYKDWDTYENGEEEEDEDDDVFDDVNGTPVFVGDKVYWNDEAGIDEKGDKIVFTVVDIDGTGYFNLSYGEDDLNPDRWAYRKEIEVIEG